AVFDWALRGVKDHPDYALRPLAGNVTKRLYAATREEDAMQPYMAHFLRLGRTEAVKLQRS
ncbi:MAG: LysR family transcriptional regulator, partial [Gemmobacter sp.]|nr:LysR family transcriptional regulator [Gemmobacter sp.]